MFEFEISTDIDATAQDIWDLIDDTSRYPEWVDPTDRMLATAEGGLKLGATYREYGGIPPFKGESDWVVTEYEPLTRQVHVGEDGAIKMTLVVELTPSQSGTRFTQSLKLTPRWWLRVTMTILWPLLMSRRGKAAIRQTHTNAKAILEASKDA